MKIKNWSQFQHYKNRKPPWIKVYRDILDDPEWHELNGASAKVLIMLWLIASESDNSTGEIPAIKTLAFRLRTTEQEINDHIIQLSHWIKYDASDLLAERLHDAIPETERETDKRQRRNSVGSKKKITYPDDFEALWKMYPGTAGSKKDAFKEYKKAEIGVEEMIPAIEKQIAFKSQQKKSGEFASSWPHLCRWISKERWNDKMELSNLSSSNRQHEREQFSFPEGEVVSNEL